MDKDLLTGFSLKFSREDKIRIKQLCIDDSHQFQYQLFDAAVLWSLQNQSNLRALANPKSGSYSSFYISLNISLLRELELCWDCGSSRALYTAVLSYLSFKEQLLARSRIDATVD